jgi:hypothetical protein
MPDGNGGDPRSKGGKDSHVELDEPMGTKGQRGKGFLL